jgi:LL-diaminopimelate aminotransferase
MSCAVPRATFDVWASVPEGYSSASFAERVLREAGVVITPGSGFGKSGEGYVRFSLTVPSERLQEALTRIKALRM